MISFIGVCKKYIESHQNVPTVKGGNYTYNVRSLIGLSEVFFSTIYPLDLKSIYFAFTINQNSLVKKPDFFKNHYLVLHKDGENKEIARLTISMQVFGEGDGCAVPEVIIATNFEGVLPEPGVYSFKIVSNETTETIANIGNVIFGSMPTLSLTTERIKAIKSDALSAKWIKFSLTCRSCKDEINILSGLERSTNDRDKSCIWYEDVPENFVCKGGNTNQTLKYLKEGLPSLLGYNMSLALPENQEIEQLYKVEALEKIIRDYKTLIDKNASNNEEEIQKFLEENEIIFSLFSPKLVGTKNPILSKYTTDFTVLNNKGELLFIEIEKPSTNLFKQDGGQHSDLTHAFDQVEDWLAEYDKHQHAVIESLKISELSTTDVLHRKGVVIAGRTPSDNPGLLGKIYKRDIDFYTYDDIYRHLLKVLENFKNL